MITKKSVTKFDNDKYYVDLNESSFTDRSFMVGFFRSVLARKKIFKTKVKLDYFCKKLRESTMDEIVRELNKLLKDEVVFYHGPGDDDSDDVYVTSLPIGSYRSGPSKTASVNEDDDDDNVPMTQKNFNRNLSQRKSTKKRSTK